jgi:hypothetical protein
VVDSGIKKIEEQIMVERFDPKAEKKEMKLSPFKDVLDEQSIEWNEERRRERGDKPRSKYASDYGQCMRKTWFQFFPDKYPTAAFDPRTLRIFHNGEAVHERLSQYFHKSKLPFLEEEDVPRDVLDVHGRCDGISMHNQRFFVLEFKSINARTVYKAKEEHEGQLTWYMHMWEELRKDLHEEFDLVLEMAYEEEQLKEMVSNHSRKWDDLRIVEKMLLMSAGPVKGEIIYESKQTQELFHFPLEIEGWRVEKVRKWYEQLQWYIDMEQMPSVKYDKFKFPCKWGKGNSAGQCAFWEICHGDGSSTNM